MLVIYIICQFRAIQAYCDADDMSQWPFLSQQISSNLHLCSGILDSQSVVLVFSPLEVGT